MVFAGILLGIASLVSLVLGALPQSGSSYFIQNPQSALVMDDRGASSATGNTIISYPVKPTTTSNQQWTIKQIGTVTLAPASGVFLLTCVSPQIQVYVNGLPGNAFNAQNFGSPLVITELREGIYSIGFPWTSLALTTTGKANDALTLQPFNPINPLQQWLFSPAFGAATPGGSPKAVGPGPSTKFSSNVTAA